MKPAPSPSPTPLQITAGDPSFARVAAVLIGIGALGVVVTSGFYAMAGPEAALPGGAASVEIARTATAAAAGRMRAAGLVGMPSDVLLAVGALLMAAMKRGPGAGLAMAGWLALALAGGLFVIVDAMVALVLPPMAALAQGDAAYLGLRTLFDTLFAIGAWAAGLGALAAAWSAQWPEYRWRVVLWLMRTASLIGLVANTAYLLGLPGSRLIGPGVALLAVAGVVLAVGLYAHPDHRSNKVRFAGMPSGNPR